MKNLKINSKLMVMVIIPMIGLLYFSTTAVITQINERVELGRLEDKTMLVVKSLDVVHELQKEQGIAARYYTDQTEINRNSMLDQRKDSNQSIENLKQYVQTLSKNRLDATSWGNLLSALEMLEELDLERSSIDNHTMDKIKFLTHYDDMFGSVIHLIDQMKLTSPNIEISARLSAFQSFSKSKFALSQERILIGSILYNNSISATDINNISLLDYERMLYFNEFTSNADADWLSQYKSVVKGQVIDEVNRIRYIVMNGANGENPSVNPEYWYHQSTDEIDLMKQAEDQYASSVIRQIDKSRVTALSWLGFMILLNILIIFVSLSLLMQVWFTFHEMMGEKERQYWLKAEFARLTELSLGMTDIEKLVEMLISEISKLIEVGQGAFYVKETGKDSEHIGDFVLLGSYAYTERENIPHRFRLGEGLVGQCALEKNPILLTQVPAEYIQISSGLGEGKPLTILLIPIIFEEEVVAVIELASFKAFTPTQQNLLELLSTPLGVIINSAASRQRTEESLLESQLLAEKAILLAAEAQIQQEELRKSNEELEEQTQMLKRSEEKLKLQSEELQAINDEMAIKTKRLEMQTKDIVKQNETIQLSKDDLEVKADELEMASNYKSEFLANMSHELRTPLNSLLILAKLLANNQEGNLTDDQIESAQIIHSGGLNLLTLINDILDLSKVEVGKLNVIPEEVKLESIVHNLKYQFNVIAQDKGLPFEPQIEEGIPRTIITDGQRTEQVLKNFLSNAFKFTSIGTVSLRISRPTADVQFINKTLMVNNTIAFIVSDTGIGIAPNKQKAIFESFQQADGSTSRKYGGTGLGLSISRELAKLLGGEIQLVSQEGVGSTFTLFLPLDMQNVLSTEYPINSTPLLQNLNTSIPFDRHLEIQMLDDVKESLSGRKILLVDDDLRNTFALSKLLQHYKMDVVMADNGKLALEMLDQVPGIELVIMDIMMPVMDGYEAMRRIRENPQFDKLPIIALTANAMVGDREKCIEGGASDYMTKPIDMDNLVSLIRVWLSY